MLGYLLIIKTVVLVMTVVRFYETLIFDLNLAMVFRVIQMYLGVIILSLVIRFFYKIRLRYLVAWLVFLNGMIGFAWLTSKQEYFLLAYPDFGVVSYHPFYIGLIAFMTLLIIIGGLRHLFGGHVENKYDQVNNRVISLSFIVPTTFYLIYIMEWMGSVQIFYGLLSVSSIVLLMVIVRYTPGELLPLTFIQLVEDIRETVILFDSGGQVIYHNSTAFALELNLTTMLCDNCYNSLFDAFDIVKRQGAEADLKIELAKDGERYYLRCKQKEIFKGDKSLGYLLVIEDLSHLETMLKERRESTEALHRINESLKEHASVVATIEAERERNRLMLEVQSYMGHRFAELTKVIENIIGSTENETDEQVILQIKETVELARETLGDIRKTVVDYRSSYDKSYTS